MTHLEPSHCQILLIAATPHTVRIDSMRRN